MSDSQVDFYYDFVSPYAYLASTQIEEICKRHGASVRSKPFLLGAVFQATGNSSPITNPAKAAYMTKDLDRWRAFYGIEGGMPSNFPINTVKSLRAALAADQQGAQVPFAHAMYRAYWVDDRDISDDAVIADVADGVGLDGAAIVAATAAGAIKQQLRDNTEAAVAAGAFGAPCFVYRGELYWGNDRLQLLEWALQYR